MKKQLSAIFISVAISVLSGCSGGDAGDAMLARIDSLQAAVDSKTQEYDNLSLFVNTVAESLDSISAQEELLFSSVKLENGRSSKESIRNNIESLSRLIERQRQTINRMADSLRAKGNGANMTQIEKLNGIVAYLNSQLAAKDAEVKRIQKQLQGSKANIAQLRASVSALKENVASLETKNEKLDEALTVQDEIVNECYVKVGTKKELEAAGILTKGGLFKKRKMNYSAFSASSFQRVDIRRVTEIPISGKKAKLLTVAPAGSYSLVKNGKNQWTLQILDPTQFWSVSNYLVIQTD